LEELIMGKDAVNTLKKEGERDKKERW